MNAAALKFFTDLSAATPDRVHEASLCHEWENCSIVLNAKDATSAASLTIDVIGMLNKSDLAEMAKGKAGKELQDAAKEMISDPNGSEAQKIKKLTDKIVEIMVETKLPAPKEIGLEMAQMSSAASSAESGATMASERRISPRRLQSAKWTIGLQLRPPEYIATLVGTKRNEVDIDGKRVQAMLSGDEDDSDADSTEKSEKKKRRFCKGKKHEAEMLSVRL